MKELKRHKSKTFVTLIFILLILVLSIIGSLNLLADNKMFDRNYYGYLDTGEGTYIVLKFETIKGKLGKSLECFSDGALIAVDNEITESLRGKIPSKNLKIEDAQKISKAFHSNKAVNLIFTKLTFKGNKLSFNTEQKMIEPGVNMQFRFVGNINSSKTKVSGKLFYKYSSDNFEMNQDIEFCSDKK